MATSCASLGEAEHLLAARIRAGKLSADQKAQVATAQTVVRPICADPKTAAADPGSPATLRHELDALNAILTAE